MSKELNEVLRAAKAVLEAATPHIQEDGHASGLEFVPADRMNWLRDVVRDADDSSTEPTK